MQSHGKHVANAIFCLPFSEKSILQFLKTEATAELNESCFLVAVVFHVNKSCVVPVCVEKTLFMIGSFSGNWSQ